MRHWLVAPTVALLLMRAGAALADAQSDLEKAHSAYVAHKYEDAEKRLRELLDGRAGGLKDPDSVADGRMYLGAVLLAEGKKDEAARLLEQLLLDKPDYQPDPLRVSLPAIDALIDARSRLRDKLAALQTEKVRAAQEEKAKAEVERKKAALRLAMLEKLASEEVVVDVHSRWIALVPFGVGQFQNGQTALGAAFFTGEALLAVGSVIGAGVMLYDSGQASDALARGDATTSKNQNARAQYAATVGDWLAAGFVAAAVLGVVHAQWTFVPERVETRKRAIPVVSLAPIIGPVLGIDARF